MKQIKRVTMVFLVVVLLMGCGFNRGNGNNTDNGGNNATDNEVQNGNTTDQEAGNNDDNANNEDQGQLEVADEAAERVTELEEVNSATVILTDNNAYTAVVLNDQNSEDLAVELEDKIAEQVRGTNTSIENVYVSLNPDFVQRMTDYETQINEGSPVEGFFEEFAEAMNRMFPDPR